MQRNLIFNVSLLLQYIKKSPHSTKQKARADKTTINLALYLVPRPQGVVCGGKIENSLESVATKIICMWCLVSNDTMPFLYIEKHGFSSRGGSDYPVGCRSPRVICLPPYFRNFHIERLYRMVCSLIHTRYPHWSVPRDENNSVERTRTGIETNYVNGSRYYFHLSCHVRIQLPIPLQCRRLRTKWKLDSLLHRYSRPYIVSANKPAVARALDFLAQTRRSAPILSCDDCDMHCWKKQNRSLRSRPFLLFRSFLFLVYHLPLSSELLGLRQTDRMKTGRRVRDDFSTQISRNKIFRCIPWYLTVQLNWSRSNGHYLPRGKINVFNCLTFFISALLWFPT